MHFRPNESRLIEEPPNLAISLEEQVVLALSRTHKGVRLGNYLPDELTHPLTFLVKCLLHLLLFGRKLNLVILRHWHILLLGLLELGSLFVNVPFDKGIDLLLSWLISRGLINHELLGRRSIILRVVAL